MPSARAWRASSASPAACSNGSPPRNVTPSTPRARAAQAARIRLVCDVIADELEDALRILAEHIVVVGGAWRLHRAQCLILEGEQPPDDTIRWLSHAGLTTRGIQDTALLLDVLAGHNDDAKATTWREALAARLKSQPDDWRTFNTQSLLGEALLAQKKPDAAALKQLDPSRRLA